MAGLQAGDPRVTESQPRRIFSGRLAHTVALSCPAESPPKRRRRPSPRRPPTKNKKSALIYPPGEGTKVPLGALEIKVVNDQVDFHPISLDATENQLLT